MGLPVFTYTTTIGLADINPLTLPPAGHWARAKPPTNLVIVGVGSVFVIGTGDLEGQTFAAWHELVANGTITGYEKEIRTIGGTGSGSTALKITIGWER